MGAHPQRKDQALETGQQPQENQENATSYLSAGALIKEARLSQNKKIPAISRELKIAEHYLTSIENGDTHDLPERVYTLGFVRTYSAYLGLDARAVVDQFKAESAGFKDQTRPYMVPEPYTPEKGPSRSLFFVTTLLLVLAGGAWLGYHFWYEEQDAQQTTPLAPAPSAPTPVIQEEAPQINHVPAPSPEHEPGAPHQPTFSQEAEDFARSLVSRFTPTQETAPTPSSPEVASPEASIQSAPASAPLEATPTTATSTALHFDQESWIQIRDSAGNIVVRRLFQAGQSYTIPQGTHLSLRVGNAGGVRFERGTQKSAPLGKKGEIVADVSLDPASIDGYLKAHE